jgi:LCP family protein required for cell wall assembly
LPILLAVLLLGLYLLAPGRTNVLVLGIDAREGEGSLGRTDTNILVTVVPSRGYVGMLSIPRDLWVTIPGYGENRINTAHFFAEADRPGAGPAAALETVEVNFGLPMDSFVRIQFEGLQQVVDAMGGIEIDLDSPQSGLPAGRHLLNGEQALTFVRDREGSDDFFRMARGQIFLRGTLGALLKPQTWPRLPGVIRALPDFLETDIPIWLWPRLGLAVLRTGPDGIDNRVISREMVVPFTTEGGANVLAPDWTKINPVLEEMFGPGL